MKLILKIAFLLILTHTSFAETVYGLERLKKYHAPMKRPVYVQMASFTKLKLAASYQSRLQQNTASPVLIKRAHGHYKVLVGPFHNQASLNELIQDLNPEAPASTISKKPKHLIQTDARPKPSVVAPKEHKAPSKATWTRVSTLSFGPSWSNSGSTQTFYLEPTIQKTYAAANDNPTIANAEFYLSWQRALSPSLLWQIGGVLAESYNKTLTGDVWEDADPDFDNFSYKYKVNHLHVGLKTKLLLQTQKAFQPYMSAGLAVGRNDAYGFTVTPKLVEEVPAPPFASKSVTSLTYTLGLGAQKAINKNWATGLGYEFGAWGGSSLGSASGQTLNSGLVLNQVYNHQLQLSFSYLPNE
jgi:hypothetical protein